MVAAIAALAGAGVSVGTSIYQMSRANRIEREAGRRPKYEIPESVSQGLDLAKTRANRTELPGQSQIEEGIRESSAIGMRNVERAATSSADILGSIPGVVANEQRAKRDLGIAGAEFKNQNEQNLIQELARYGMYEDRQFNINQMEPWMDAQAVSSALRGASIQNLNTGVNVASEALVNQSNINDLKRLLENQGGGGFAKSSGGNRLNTPKYPWEEQNQFGSGSWGNLGQTQDFSSALLDKMLIG